MSEEIVWKDPPRGSGRQGIWVERLSPLLNHPNRWAMVAIAKSTATANQLRKGMFRIPEGEWEFRHHGTPNGCEIYARYLGPKEGES